MLCLGFLQLQFLLAILLKLIHCKSGQSTAYCICIRCALYIFQYTLYPSANVTGVVVVATNTTSVRVSWLAVQGLPQDGILTGYTVYYRSLPNTSKRQLGGYISQTFPPTTTSGDITNLSSNGVYKFSVVAMDHCRTVI